LNNDYQIYFLYFPVFGTKEHIISEIDDNLRDFFLTKRSLCEKKARPADGRARLFSKG
jgi:hypothetical protein